MKTKLFLASVIILTFRFLSSCNDIIEKDLSDKWVYGITPPDFSVSQLQTQTFKWEKVEGAESYNLQIYKTSIDYGTITEFIADTNVRATEYVYALKPGFYKWYIYAQNGGGKSGLSIFRFQIDSTGDVSTQKVILLYPPDKKVSDSLEQTFRWAPLTTATAYNIQIFTATGNTALYSKNVTSTSETYTFTNPGTYKWRVFAMNGTLVSPYTEYTLTIDTAITPIPVIVSPKNDTTLKTQPVALKWNAVKDATEYSFQITKDIHLPETQMDSVAKTTYNYCNYYSSVLNTKYYWRVKAIRKNKESEYSEWNYFRRN
jgi:hypothetical protein